MSEKLIFASLFHLLLAIEGAKLNLSFSFSNISINTYSVRMIFDCYKFKTQTHLHKVVIIIIINVLATNVS